MPNYQIILSIILLAWFAQSEATPSCSVSIQRQLNFGNYNPLRNKSDKSTARIKVRCTGQGSVSYQLLLSAGQAGHFYPRAMLQNGGDSQLLYNIYINSARSQIWGDGSGSTYSVSKSKASPFVKRHTAYGEIPAKQSRISVGSYNDNITVTLNY